MNRAVSRQLLAVSVKRLLCISVLALTAIRPAVASGAGTTTAEFLRISPHARPAASGDAYTASADGVASLHYNPAGIAWTPRREVAASYQNLVLDISQGHLGYAMPLRTDQGIGLSLTYLSYGRTPQTRFQTTGAVVTAFTDGTFAGSDLALKLTYGQRVNTISWGVSGALLQSSIAGVTANSAAIDLGLNWRSSVSPLSLGVSLLNIGPKLSFVRDRDPLPFLFRAGASYAILENRLSGRFDLEKSISEPLTVLTGLEYWIVPVFAMRAGYDGRIDADNGLTFGAGFKHHDLDLDYAYVPFGGAGSNHRLSLRYMFGATRIHESAVDFGRAPTQPTAGPPTERAPARPVERRHASRAIHPRAAAANDTAVILFTDHMRAGNSAAAAGRDVEAAAAYASAVKLDPASGRAWYNLATIRYRQKKYAAARDAYLRSLKIEPNDTDALIYLGHTYVHLGEKEKARKVWHQAWDLAPGDRRIPVWIKSLGRRNLTSERR